MVLAHFTNEVDVLRRVCRVTVKVGIACAIKTGMGSEDRAMEENDGFGLCGGSVADVVDVAVGTQAADDGGTGRGGRS